MAPTKEVSAIPPSFDELVALPYQAIECHLANVMPIETEWTDATGEFVWQECGYSDSLYAKVSIKIIIYSFVYFY